MLIPQIFLFQILLLSQHTAAYPSPQTPPDIIPDLGAVEKGYDFIIGIPGAIKNLFPPFNPQEPKRTPQSQEQDEPQNHPATTTEQCVSDPRFVANPSSTCEKIAYRVIIYPMTCSATADNNAITQIILGFVGIGGYYASLDRQRGVSFWATSLTLDQSERLRKTKGVKGVAPDGIVTNVSSRKRQKQKQNQDISVNNNRPEKRNRIKKRDGITSRLNKEKDLAFLSTAKHWILRPIYYYFRKAGRGTMIYSLNFGVEENHPEFTANSNIQNWLYGRDAIVYRSDDDIHASGTCNLSKSIGSTLGVSNLAWATVVKVARSISSYLSGFQVVINDLDQKPPETVQGWTVFETSLGWELDDPDIENDELNQDFLKRMLSILSNEYKMVVVVPAGNYDGINLGQDRYQDISRIPALYSTEETLSVITVGAVDQGTGHPFIWSNGGTALTISAPGTGTCAGRDNNKIDNEGTNNASSIIAGLALYFLSLEDMGPQIRGEVNMAQALEKYIVGIAYERPDTTVKSAFNGLNPNDPNDFGWVAR